jgi:putative N-acetyltransferase (TIGR04045 family)
MYTFYDEPVGTYRPGEYRIKHVTEHWEARQCAQLRRDVFCVEQGVFADDDRDAIDDIAVAIAAVACTAGMPEQVVGTVRIHQRSPRQWSGSRLAVAMEYRGVAWLGGELIRHAVCTAHALGCDEFLAQVQAQNVRLFERLHWQSIEQVMIHGRLHALMRADLSRYPPRTATEICFAKAARRAA